jgi:S1-C subfamily serine protease
MRANVRIEVDKGGGRALGSGVIFRIAGATAWIVTNRHVVDGYFAETQGAAVTPLTALPPASVTYVTNDTETAEVLWVAPNGVDLAVIKSPCPASGIAAALWNIETPITQGQEVFAVGNPAGLGWTLTRGTVSALRRQTSGKSTIPVIQTDAAISPGNSGGGLYTQDGMLIGINDFIINPALASNAGFAIRFELLDQLHPGGIDKFTDD